MNRQKESEFMSERRSGRKKHLVEGEVSEVKRSARVGTQLKVGDAVGFMTAFRRLIKGIKNDQEEKE